MRGLVKIIGLCALGFSAVGATAIDKKRPNILFINADDLNNNLGTYGHPQVKSPNLDQLAATGMRFNQAYSQNPLCTPSRSSYMTGLYPYQAGVVAHGDHYRTTAHFRDYVPKVTTLPQLFKNNGYTSIRIGKIYHQGVPGGIGKSGPDDAASWDKVYNPVGVDRDVEDRVQAITKRAMKRKSFGGTISWLSVESDDKEHTDGKIATQAIKVLEDNHPDKTGKPFFLAVGFYRPHTPYVAPTKYFDQYPIDTIKPYMMPKNDRQDIPLAGVSNDRPGQMEMTMDMRKAAIQGYYASVSYMDAQVGRVLDGLKRLKLDNDTIVVFFSDHGYELGQHGLWQKGSLFEGSARVPLIMRVPGMKTAGQATNNPTELLDVYPTLAALAGIKAPEYLAGKSLVPVLKDAAVSVQQAAYTSTPTRNNTIIQKRLRVVGHSIRTERYRYTEWGNGVHGVELYDHKNDPEELKNLANKASHEDIRVGLERLLRDKIDASRKRIRSIEK